MNLQQAIELGIEHHRAGRRPEAQAIYQQILSQNPNQPDALRLMGMLAYEGARNDLAIDFLGRAIAAQPNAPVFHADLAMVLSSMGRLDEALLSYQQALNLEPQAFEYLNRLGGLQLQMGRTGEAVASFRRAVSLRGDFVDALSNLATALMVDGKIAEAIETGKRALAINPNLPTVWNNLAVAMVKSNLFEQAIPAFEKAIALSPGMPDTIKDLAAAQLEAGRVQEAISSYDRVLAANPTDAIAAGARVYAMNFLPEPDAQGMSVECGHWNERFAVPLRRQIIPSDNDRSPDRMLRVGYLSPTPHMHSVAFFIRALLAAHDPGAVEVFLYCDALDSSQISPGLRQYPKHWRNIGGLSDAAAAQIVRNDRIDILVDLAGHTHGNRILLLARKPAPVQVLYLGYAGTTGLGAMDYRLTDALADPPGAGDRFYSEKLMRLPNTFLCMLPDSLLPPIGPLPAESAGHITFGTFERLAKINPRMIDVWSQILQKVDGSRLLIQCAALTDPNSRDRLAAQFAKKGIDRQRLDFHGWQRDRREHLQAYNHVDIALDTYPYNGRAVNCELLWMGVPVVTLAGRTHASRVGASILTSIAQERLIAKNAENYLRLAVELASDRGELLRLRGELRPSMQKSPLMDAKAFAGHVEAAYRDMWRRWCAGVTQLESTPA